MSLEKVLPDNEYSQQYSEKKFWDKLVLYAKSAGSEVVERALQLTTRHRSPTRRNGPRA